MIDHRFSAAEFERAAAAGDSALRALIEALEQEVTVELRPAIEHALGQLAERLNYLGHELRPVPLDEPYEVEWCHGEAFGPSLRLWVSHDSTVTVGYAGRDLAWRGDVEEPDAAATLDELKPPAAERRPNRHGSAGSHVGGRIGRGFSQNRDDVGIRDAS
jgi:hypothetical protein